MSLSDARSAAQQQHRFSWIGGWGGMFDGRTHYVGTPIMDQIASCVLCTAQPHPVWNLILKSLNFPHQDTFDLALTLT